jgi:hypothetical protein
MIATNKALTQPQTFSKKGYINRNALNATQKILLIAPKNTFGNRMPSGEKLLIKVIDITLKEGSDNEEKEKQ